MSIKIFGNYDGSIEVTYTGQRRELPVIPTPLEAEALELIFGILAEVNIAKDEILLQRRSADYLTFVVAENNDVLRLKVTNMTAWFSLSSYQGQDAQFKNDSRFSHIEKKRTNHWKIPLSFLEDLQLYADLIQTTFVCARKG